MSRADAVKAARAHLRRYARLYRLSGDDLASIVTGPVHDTGRGAVIVPLRAMSSGLEIFREELKVAMGRDLTPIALAGSIAGVSEALARPSARGFKLSPAEAAAEALGDLMQRPVGGDDLEPAGGATGPEQTFGKLEGSLALAGIALPDPARVRKVLFRLRGDLEPAYFVELVAGEEGTTETDFYAYVVSAADGRILFRHDQTASDVFDYRVWADASTFVPHDGPQGTAGTPHPAGITNQYQAPFTAPPTVSLQNVPFSKNDPWLPSGATETLGNNADAYADIASPDGFSATDLRATTTDTGEFIRVYDVGQLPHASPDQRMAAVTQLFFDVNFFHDWFYDSGFDEASGNAQTSNYGRGGLENDSMRAEAQDYSGRNNANMSTPSDGGRPRMQMYVFNGRPRRSLTVTSPASIAGVYSVGTAPFGAASFNLTNQVILVNDGSTAGSGTVTDGCQTPFANAAAVTGRIALVDRGTCGFTVKVKNAQLNGAVAVVVANNVAGLLDMTGTDATITIGSLLISQTDGDLIKAQLGSGVTTTLFREPTIDHDGTIDNQVVAHEWGHYISNRLIGNATGLSNQQGGGMGEGWGDFHALLISAREEDTLVASNASWRGVYAMAGYVTSGGTNFGAYNDGYYFGIRRYPYSTDFTKNPLTFRYITSGVALPPEVPFSGDPTGANNAQVHRTGEVWATMLWECYTSLLRDTGRLSFEEAQQRMRDYLVAGYKLTPNAPTFVEARDALLAAAYASDPADFALFWQSFARRGAGVRAVAPDRHSTTHQGVVESYVVGGDLAVESVTLDDSIGSCDADGYLDAGETGRLTITLRNAGNSSLSATTATVSSADARVEFLDGGDLVFPASAPLEETTASLRVRLASGGPGIEALAIDIAFTDPGFVIPGAVTERFETRGHADEVPAQSATDDVESRAAVWTAAGSPALDPSGDWERRELTYDQHDWFGPDPGGISDQRLESPPLQVASSGSFVISFRHRHAFEASGGPFFDGGVIELSAGGGPWTDIGALAAPGYGGILVTGGGNPLESRNAYVGTSAGYPAFNTVTINLGTAYAGQTVRIRFRIGADAGVGAPGWEIDDIAFQNITNLPFPVLHAETDLCPDTDLDGVPDPGDCLPGDGDVWSAPTEARDLVLSGNPTVLSWADPVSPGAATPAFDVLRAAAAGPAGFSAAVCLETNDTDRTAVDAGVPAPGSIAYYLIRSRNACGSTLGTSSSGAPRLGASCP